VHTVASAEKKYLMATAHTKPRKGNIGFLLASSSPNIATGIILQISRFVSFGKLDQRLFPFLGNRREAPIPILVRSSKFAREGLNASFVCNAPHNLVLPFQEDPNRWLRGGIPAKAS
jgi:hypothetical protein